MDPVTFINRGGRGEKAWQKTSISDELWFGLVGAAAQEVWEVRVNETKSSGRLYLHLASTGGFGIIQNIPVKNQNKDPRNPVNPELEEVGIQLKLGVPTSTRYAVFF